MKKLALDLATTTGWASEAGGIIASGTASFKPGKHSAPGMRFILFRKWLREMIATEKPDVVYYEAVRRHLGTDAAHIHGALLGIMQAELDTDGIPYHGIAVATIKKKATGKGNADKAAMIEAAKRTWPDQDIADDNQADALWIMEASKDL